MQLRKCVGSRAAVACGRCGGEKVEDLDKSRAGGSRQAKFNFNETRPGTRLSNSASQCGIGGGSGPASRRATGRLRQVPARRSGGCGLAVRFARARCGTATHALRGRCSLETTRPDGRCWMKCHLSYGYMGSIRAKQEQGESLSIWGYFGGE